MTEDKLGTQSGTGAPSPLTRPLLIRSATGGVLMGLANLVPGVSGGTMLLAAGVYRDFVGAIASLTRLEFKLRPVVILGTIATCAALAILLGAGLLKDLVVHHRWVMYSLFIGLTLGGVPLVWRPVRHKTPAFLISAASGLAGMIGLFLLQNSVANAQSGGGFAGLLVAGTAGASAMILPGLSGGYLLLLLGQYVPILSGVDRLKDALVARDLAALFEVGVEIVLPVGLGVVLGVVVISNLVQWFFKRYEAATYGILLGLLLGATIGLWPFQQSVDPVPGETVIKGQLVTEESLATIDAEDFPLEYFRPSPGQSFVALLLLAGGIAATLTISRTQGSDRSRSS